MPSTEGGVHYTAPSAVRGGCQSSHQTDCHCCKGYWTLLILQRYFMVGTAAVWWVSMVSSNQLLYYCTTTAPTAKVGGYHSPNQLHCHPTAPTVRYQYVSSANQTLPHPAYGGYRSSYQSHRLLPYSQTAPAVKVSIDRLTKPTATIAYVLHLIYTVTLQKSRYSDLKRDKCGLERPYVHAIPLRFGHIRHTTTEFPFSTSPQMEWQCRCQKGR